MARNWHSSRPAVPLARTRLLVHRGSADSPHKAATAARALVTSHFEELTHYLHRDPKFGRPEGLVRSIAEFREPELPADRVVGRAG